MKLFSKLKDYNNLLEEILEQKTFSSIAKSLLLSMVYKLEISYKDYQKVKVDAISKDEFFENILNIIKKYCDNIKVVEPETSQAKLLIKNNVQAVTNTRERSILSYPTEAAILYAVSDVEPKYFFVKKDFELKNILQRILVEAYKSNTVTILKEFNGWSWDIDLREKNDYSGNLIYQNLMMIKGEKFLYEWRTDNKAKKDYLESVKRSVKKVTGNDEYFNCLCRVLEIKSSKSDEQRELEELIILQKYFLEYFCKKVSKMTLREEIIHAIYQIRLYKNLVLCEGKNIKSCKELKNDLDSALKLLITNACKIGVIKIISMDIETNFEIMKFVLDTKIIDLEQIKIYLEIEEKDIQIKVYDKEIFEKQGKIQFSGNKKDIEIRKKRKVKLFN